MGEEVGLRRRTSAGRFGIECAFQSGIGVVACLRKLCSEHTVHTAGVARKLGKRWGGEGVGGGGVGMGVGVG